MVEEFSGKLLIQQEPDASSFLSGGIRNTFEARGYSAWNSSSPAFIVGDTLCIPTIFIAYTGESLDYKAPLLKALEAVNKAAVDVCHYFQPGGKESIFLPRLGTGIFPGRRRTLRRPPRPVAQRTYADGHESSKTSSSIIHYFGAIPTRVMEFMKELEMDTSNWVSH